VFDKILFIVLKGDTSCPTTDGDKCSESNKPNCQSRELPRGFSKVPNRISQKGNISARLAS
jgi:hypothetical protein